MHAASRAFVALGLLGGCAIFPPKPPTPERAREWIVGQRLPLSVDLIIVHGCPARADGAPSTCNRRRARAAVKAYEAGMAPFVLFTGGAVLNPHAEATVTAEVAVEMGLPRAAVLTEVESRHTVTNLSVARGIMRQKGMKTALLVSEAMHLVWAKQLANFYGMTTWLWPDDPLPPYTDAYARSAPSDEYEPWATQTGAYGAPGKPLGGAGGADRRAPSNVAILLVPDATLAEPSQWDDLIDGLIASGAHFQIFEWSQYDALPHSADRLRIFVDAWTRGFNGPVNRVEVVAFGAGGIVAATAASRFEASPGCHVHVTAAQSPLKGMARYKTDWSREKRRAFLWPLNGTIAGYDAPAAHVTFSESDALPSLEALFHDGAALAASQASE